MDEAGRKHIKRFSALINSCGERMTLDFIDGELYAQNAQKTATHEVCKGRMTFHRVSENWAVLRCASCNLRVYIPAKNLSESGLLAWLGSQTNKPCAQVPCGTCKTTDSDSCYVCNDIPPKNKISER